MASFIKFHAPFARASLGHEAVVTAHVPLVSRLTNVRGTTSISLGANAGAIKSQSNLSETKASLARPDIGDHFAAAVTEQIEAHAPGGRRWEPSSPQRHSGAAVRSDRTDPNGSSGLAMAMDDLIQSDRRNAPDRSERTAEPTSAGADAHAELAAAIGDLIQTGRR